MPCSRFSFRACCAFFALASLPLLMGQGCPVVPQPGALTASAGPDFSVTVGDAIALQGSASGGSGGYTYAWSPAANLSATNVATPTFTSSTDGTFIYVLTVTDSSGATATDSMNITVTEEDGGGTPGGPLVVSAGIDRNATVGAPITIVGSASGGSGSYAFSWAPISGLTNTSSRTPIFTPPSAGSFTLTLTVTDVVSGDTATDSAVVTATTSTALGALVWGPNFADGGYQVLATFTQALQESSAEMTSNYRLTANNTIQPTSATLSADGRTVTLLFTNVTLNTQSAFDISVGSGIRDINNNPVPATGNLVPASNAADTTAPTVTTKVWGVNLTDKYTVAITFSESMDEASAEVATAYRVTLSNSTRKTASTAVLGTDGKTVTVTFNNTALSTTSLIDVGVLPVLDINGLAASTLTQTSVAPNSADVDVPEIAQDDEGNFQVTYAPDFTGGGYKLFVVFDEVMSEADVEDPTGYRVGAENASSAVLDNDGRTLTLVFETPMAVETEVEIGLNGKVKDINGLAMVLQSVQPQPSPSDVTKPGTPVLRWVDGADTTMPEAYRLTATFNEAMGKASVERVTNWRISGSDPAVNPLEAMLADDGKTVTLTFDTPRRITDQLIMSAATASADRIQDINGQFMPTVTTGIQPHPETTRPTVVTGPTFLANESLYKMELDYSEAMDSASATNLENYSIVTVDGSNNITAVKVVKASTVVLGAEGRALTITFGITSTGFASNDRLLISSSVRDINGRAVNSLAPLPISAGTDTTTPTVTSVKWGTNPSPYKVSVLFSTVMDAATATDVTNYRLDNGTARVPSAASLSADGRTATLTFADFTFDVADLFSIPGTIKSITGRNLGAFVAAAPAADTTADPTAPTVTSAVWGSSLPVYTVLATFSEALDEASTLDPMDFTLSGTPATAAPILQPGGTQVLLEFSGMTFNSNATLQVALGAAGVRDMHGNPSSPSSTARNLSPNPADLLAPGVVSASWVPDFTDTGYQMLVVFDEVLDKSTAETMVFYNITGTLVTPSTAVLDVDGGTVILTFIGRALSASDTLDIKPAVKDINGRVVMATTEEPIEAASAPADGIAPGDPTVEHEAAAVVVTLVFDESLDAESVEATTFTLDGMTPPTQLGLALLDPDGKTVTVKFTADPTGRMIDVPNTITDINGNAYAGGMFAVPN